MKEPTKADLAAAVAKLTEENAGLRDLLAAVHVMADAPEPATYSDRYYWACTDRLSTIAIWAELDESATGEYADRVIRGWAKALREKAAKPVRYEVHVEPEPEPASPDAAEALIDAIVAGTPVVRVPGPHPDQSAFRHGYAPDESGVSAS